MKKVLFLGLLLAVSIFGQAQKVSVDDDVIKVNDAEYAKIKKSKGLKVDFTISGLDGTELVFFKFCEFNNPNKVSKSNPEGRVTYYEVTFLKSGQKCEVDCNATKKGVAKAVVENKLIKDNVVDEESERNFILKNGTKFSEEMKAANGPKVIIIER